VRCEFAGRFPSVEPVGVTGDLGGQDCKPLGVVRNGRNCGKSVFCTALKRYCLMRESGIREQRSLGSQPQRFSVVLAVEMEDEVVSEIAA
jgi:hypothetical protein